MKSLRINLHEDSYNIFIEDDLLLHLSFYIRQIFKGDKIYIITDDIVEALYLKVVQESLKEFTIQTVIVPHGEGAKSLDTYAEVCQKLLTMDIRRNELLLALGGGVVGDLTGFIAATLFRGLPYVNVPTTLLSQMDSSIGGKTGIDFAGRKNMIGCFKQPKVVLIDPKVLRTLPKQEWNNGMGELIKHAIIGNPALFEMLLQKPEIDETMIFESLKVKQKVVEKDVYDTGERMLLNFGHTFGHVIELEMNLKHGEAVALGMLMMLRFGIDKGITEEACYTRVMDILRLYELPFMEVDYHRYLNEIFKDKKNLAGKLSLVLIKNIGEAFLYVLNENKV